MRTFKQFLESSDPLEHLMLEMWARKRLFGGKKELCSEFASWYLGDQEDMSAGLMNAFYELFGDEMPYDVAKSRADKPVESWIVDHLSDMMRADGVEV